jgi:hypothetical protein
MRFTRNRSCLAVLIIASIAFCAGCANPTEKAYTTSTLYSQAQRDLISLKGTIPEDAFNAAADADAVAAPLVLEMNRAAVEAQDAGVALNKRYNFDVAWNAAHEAVNKFLTRVLAAKSSKR